MRRHSRLSKRKENPLEVVTDVDCSDTIQQDQQQNQLQQQQQQQRIQIHPPQQLPSEPRRGTIDTRRVDLRNANSPDDDAWMYNVKLTDDNYDVSTQIQHPSGMSTQRDDYDDSCTQSVQTQAISSEPDPTQPMKLEREETIDAKGKTGDKIDNNKPDENSTGKHTENENEKRLDCGTLIWEKDNPE